ncbi:hypothetical protein VTL71DRAFT_4378, partial [Oculimacula yallundae]
MRPPRSPPTLPSYRTHGPTQFKQSSIPQVKLRIASFLSPELDRTGRDGTLSTNHKSLQYQDPHKHLNFLRRRIFKRETFQRPRSPSPNGAERATTTCHSSFP